MRYAPCPLLFDQHKLSGCNKIIFCLQAIEIDAARPAAGIQWRFVPARRQFLINQGGHFFAKLVENFERHVIQVRQRERNRLSKTSIMAHPRNKYHTLAKRKNQ